MKKQLGKTMLTLVVGPAVLAFSLTFLGVEFSEARSVPVVLDNFKCADIDWGPCVIEPYWWCKDKGEKGCWEGSMDPE